MVVVVSDSLDLEGVWDGGGVRRRERGLVVAVCRFGGSRVVLWTPWWWSAGAASSGGEFPTLTVQYVMGLFFCCFVLVYFCF